jgi:hypothetical protein
VISQLRNSSRTARHPVPILRQLLVAQGDLALELQLANLTTTICQRSSESAEFWTAVDHKWGSRRGRLMSLPGTRGGDVGAVSPAEAGRSEARASTSLSTCGESIVEATATSCGRISLSIPRFNKGGDTTAPMFPLPLAAQR